MPKEHFTKLKREDKTRKCFVSLHEATFKRQLQRNQKHPSLQSTYTAEMNDSSYDFYKDGEDKKGVLE